LPSPAEGNVIRGSGPSSWQTTSDLYIASSSGNVGIGTTNPSSVLDVQVTTATLLTETARFSKVNSGTRGISFGGSHGSAGGYNWIKSFGTTHNLAFLDTDDHINMVISNAGYVGIGTTDPSQALHVVGSVLSVPTSGEGYLYLGDTA
jgi:hypothetical protein